MAVQALEKWSKFATVNGVKTHYYDTDEGNTDREVLTFFHGGGSAASMQWRYNIPELAKDFRVIADDRMGFGLSDVPTKWNGTIKEHTEHEVALLKHLGIKSTHICGLSQGSWRTAYVALFYPELVNKVVFCTSGSITMPLGRDNSDQEKQAKFYPSKDEMRANMLAGTKRKELLTDEYVDTVFEYQSRNFDVYANQIWPVQFGGDPEVRKHNLSIDGKHMSEFMKDLNKPTLIVWGNDHKVPAEKALWLYNTIPESALYCCTGEHTPMFEHYEVFNKLLKAFLQEDYPYFK